MLVAGLDATSADEVTQAFDDAQLRTERVRTWSELRARAAQDDELPSVVVLDLELADGQEDALVPLVRASFPHASVVAVGSNTSPQRTGRLQRLGIPSLTKPVCVLALKELVLRLAAAGSPEVEERDSGVRPSANRGSFHSLFERYAAERLLSSQQTLILRLYLQGKSDKEIAPICGCCEATVYEHWRRMARKVGASYKADVVADFHRFLTTVAVKSQE